MGYEQRTFLKRAVSYIVAGFVLGLGTCIIEHCFMRGHDNRDAVLQEKVFVWNKKHLDSGEIPLFMPPTDSDKISFIQNGDEGSFRNLTTAYIYETVEPEGVLYALVAANKFNIAKGNFFVYYYLSYPQFFSKPVTMDERTKGIALRYLQKGVSLGEVNAVSELDNLKGDR